MTALQANAAPWRVRFVLLALLAPALLALGLVRAPHAATLEQDALQIHSESNYTRLHVPLPEGAVVRVVDQIAEKNLFYIDLYGVQASFADKRILVKDGSLGALNTWSYKDPEVLRLVVYPSHKTVFRVADMDTGHVFEPTPVDAKPSEVPRKKVYDLVVDIAKYKHFPLPPLLPQETLKSIERSARLPSSESKGVKRLVVLDPGHGGDDSGATSSITFNGKKLKESDVVLSIAKEVQRLLNKTSGVNAVLTRERDVRMGLVERVDFTERLEADLFVSIHANATNYHSSPTARGVEFYYLGENSRAEVRALVEAENQVDDAALDGKESDALKRIEKNLIKENIETQRGLGFFACQNMDRVFKEDAYFQYHNRGVKKAPFRVLMNQVTPAVLVEVGFIDHEREARNLAHPDFQKRIAKRVANGILQYFAQLDSEFQYVQYKID